MSVYDEIEQRKLWLGFHWENDDDSVQDIAVEHSWWKFLKRAPELKRKANVAVRFMLDAIDDLVGVASRVLGFKYVATVQERLVIVVCELYDTVFEQVKLPLWLRPFSGMIHKFAKTVLVPLLIDYLVRKLMKGQLVV